MPIEILVTNINLIISIIFLIISFVGYLTNDMKVLNYFGILSILNMLLAMSKPIW